MGWYSVCHSTSFLLPVAPTTIYVGIPLTDAQAHFSSSQNAFVDWGKISCWLYHLTSIILHLKLVLLQSITCMLYSACNDHSITWCKLSLIHTENTFTQVLLWTFLPCIDYFCNCPYMNPWYCGTMMKTIMIF